MDNEIYVLMEHPIDGREPQPIIAHTTAQGSAAEMANYEPARQRTMWVAPSIQLVDDKDD